METHKNKSNDTEYKMQEYKGKDKAQMLLEERRLRDQGSSPYDGYNENAIVHEKKYRIIKTPINKNKYLQNKYSSLDIFHTDDKAELQEKWNKIMKDDVCDPYSLWQCCICNTQHGDYLLCMFVFVCVCGVHSDVLDKIWRWMIYDWINQDFCQFVFFILFCFFIPLCLKLLYLVVWSEFLFYFVWDNDAFVG